jgi:5'-nucleotidase
VDNCFKNLNITYEELTQLEQPKLITTSVRDVVEEYLRNHQNISSNIESRLTYIK